MNFIKKKKKKKKAIEQQVYWKYTKSAKENNKKEPRSNQDIAYQQINSSRQLSTNDGKKLIYL